MKGGVPGPGTPDGIYVYEEGKWKLLRSDGAPLDLSEAGDGVVVVYFDNALCPACRLQDRYWIDLVRRYSGDSRVKFYVVLCNWFSQNCSSRAAAESFKKYSINASPTIIVAAVKGGKSIYTEFLEGVRSTDVLSLYVSTALRQLER